MHTRDCSGDMVNKKAIQADLGILMHIRVYLSIFRHIQG